MSYMIASPYRYGWPYYGYGRRRLYRRPWGFWGLGAEGCPVGMRPGPEGCVPDEDSGAFTPSDTFTPDDVTNPCGSGQVPLADGTCTCLPGLVPSQRPDQGCIAPSGPGPTPKPGPGPAPGPKPSPAAPTPAIAQAGMGTAGWIAMGVGAVALGLAVWGGRG